MDIVAAFETAGADYAVTTEKDGVKLTHLPDTIASKVLLARLELAFVDTAPLLTLLRNLLQK
jgi:tetraacyldisaccharide-1-P 4'-kinase